MIEAETLEDEESVKKRIAELERRSFTVEKFLDWLCGVSDYTIIRCQKVTKDELRERIKSSFAEDRAIIEQQVLPDKMDKHTPELESALYNIQIAADVKCSVSLDWEEAFALKKYIKELEQSAKLGEELRDMINDPNGRLQTLTREVSAKDKRIADLEAEVFQWKRAAKSASDRADEEQAKVSAKDKRITELKHELSDIKAVLRSTAEGAAIMARRFSDEREKVEKLREACEPFRVAFHENGKYQYENSSDTIRDINDKNAITPRGVTMGDFRRLYEALAATKPKDTPHA